MGHRNHIISYYKQKSTEGQSKPKHKSTEGQIKPKHKSTVGHRNDKISYYKQKSTEGQTKLNINPLWDKLNLSIKIKKLRKLRKGN